jgi:hypothetical protein
MKLCSPVVGSLKTNDASCTSKIRSRAAMIKAAFNKEILYTSKLDVTLRNKLVKGNILSIALYGAENWISRSQIHGMF